MFEQSLVDSGKRAQAGRTRWLVAVSLGVQAAVVAGFVAVPLMWPAVLPVVVAAPRVATVMLPKPKVQEESHKPAEAHLTNNAALRVPRDVPETRTVATVRGGGVIARGSLASANDDDAPTLGAGNGMGSLFAGGLGVGDLAGPAVRVVEAAPPKPAGPVHVSSGVIAGLLLAPIAPTYPAIAKAARVEGTVVLTAVIGKDGRIRGLEVVSGPEMLRRAALDAVQAARYTPFALNGAPTEVVTTVSVVFRIDF